MYRHIGVKCLNICAFIDRVIDREIAHDEALIPLVVLI